MTIVIYTGDTGYSVFNIWAQHLKTNFEKLNHEIILIPLGDDNGMALALNIFSTKQIDFVIGYNGFGVDLKIGEDSVYNMINVPFLAMYVDQPIYHTERLSQNVNNYIALFIDKSHIDFVENILPNHHKIKAFLPPSSNSDKEFFDSFEQYIDEKDIDILFTGTYLGDPKNKKTWENHPGIPKTIFNKMADHMIEDPYATLQGAISYAFKDSNLQLNNEFYLKIAKVMPDVMTYVRSVRRDKLIIELCKSGLNIIIYGKNWDSLSQQYPNLDYRGVGDANDTINISRRAKVIINNNTNFTHGAHERVFTAIYGGAVVFSDTSSYYEDRFNDMESILFYNLNSLDKDLEKIKTVLNDDKLRFNIASKAFNIVKQNDTWAHRCQQFIEIVKTYKLLNNC